MSSKNPLRCINTKKDLYIYINVVYDDLERAWTKGALFSVATPDQTFTFFS